MLVMSSLFLRCTSTATGTFVVLFVPVAVSTNKADTCVVGVVERDHDEEWLGLFDLVATLDAVDEVVRKLSVMSLLFLR